MDLYLLSCPFCNSEEERKVNVRLAKLGQSYVDVLLDLALWAQMVRKLFKGMKKKMTVNVAKEWYRLPTEIVKFPPLELFKTGLDPDLSNQVSLAILWAGGFD